MRRSLAVDLLRTLLAIVAATTVIGLITLWPRGDGIDVPEGSVAAETYAAEIEAVSLRECRVPGEENCLRVTARLEEGPDAGETTTLNTSGAELDLSPGDDVRLFRNPQPQQQPGTPIPRPDAYAFSDFERDRPLLLLVFAFVSLVLVAARWRGLRALVGLVASLAIIVLFVVPAIVNGRDPTAVAFVGALAVMFATIPLAHGLGPKTLAACLGTTGSLVLTLSLADAFVRFAHLSGLSSEEAVYVRAAGDVSLSGLLVAGMVIGALGVLDDLTVTQASTVLALRRANASLGFTRLFREALDVGHDHITATVNTLVLAYAGAALPVLLVFHIGDVPFAEAANFEVVAGEIVGMLVGSIGLIAAVPTTTAIAALLASRVDPASLPDAHGHAH